MNTHTHYTRIVQSVTPVHAGAVRHLPHWVHVVNTLPGVLLTVFALCGVFFLFVGLFAGDGFGISMGIIFGLLCLIPIYGMQFSHRENHPISQLAVKAGTQVLWVNAHKLPDGTWWPDYASKAK